METSTQSGLPKGVIAHRLNRAIGQIQAVGRMLEEPDTYSCKEVVSQLKAARSALRKVSEIYVASQITHCLELPEPTRSEHIREAMEALAV
jgi:DNA-binding FrmR family transcriptional regulator